MGLNQGSTGKYKYITRTRSAARSDVLGRYFPGMKVWNRLLACFNGLSLLGLFLFLDLNRHKNTTARTRQQGVVKKKKASVLGRQVRHKTRIRSTLGVHSEVERAVLKCSPSEADRLLRLLQASELLWRGFLKKVVDLVHRRILFVIDELLDYAI